MRSTLLGYKRGFTLVELMVVASIIILLTLIALTYLYNARKESRDNYRINTAEQLKLGVRLYKEAHGEYPSYASGIEIGVGDAIDAELEPFLPEINPDPLKGAVPGGDYGYWYYSDFNCNGERRNVIIIRGLESEEGNYNEACGGGSSFNDEGNPFLPVAYAGYGQGSYYSQGSYYGQGSYYVQSGYYSQGSYYSQSSYYGQSSYYTQGSYYSQSSYYTQGSYYSQSSYYTEGSYGWVDSVSDMSNVHIIFVN
jgi:prepilin-type N-terminal cleavage/methylation domain-containing protein